MTLRQLHYTSAPPGPDGSGFRFTAASPGTDPALLRLTEPLLGYEPPRDAPARPTEAELGAFPVAFGFSRLPDGTGVLSRTCYTGTDYSGRYGNFHAHALLLAPGEALPEGMLPVEAWESPDWQTGTPADPAPPPLTAVRRGRRIGGQRLTAFAARRAERLAPFLADVRRLFAEERAPSLIMVEEGAEEVALWVALACAAVPPGEAAALTFTTYTRRPYLADQRIVGVPADAEFGYASADVGHQFRVHHCLGGASSEPRPDAWAAVAARVWLAGRHDLLTRAAGEAPFDAPSLAARALCEGVVLDGPGRETGARWALTHAHTGDPAFWRHFLATLLEDDGTAHAAGGPLGGTATGADGALEVAWEVLLPQLLEALAPHWSSDVTEPLARAVASLAADGLGSVSESLADALSPGARAELARSLGPRLAGRLADAAVPPGRLLDLLRLCLLLGTHLEGHPPPPAPGVRLADHLLARAGSPGTPKDGAAASGPTADEVAAVLAGRGCEAVRAGLLDRLNDVALSGDPGPVLPVLEQLAGVLDTADPAAYPHLRVVAAADRRYRGAETGFQLMTRLTQDAGGSESQDPSVLFTAFRLAWPAEPPGMDDALTLLLSLTPEQVAASGLDAALARAALAADPTDPEAAEVARRLLTAQLQTSAPMDPRLRDALNLLIHAERIRAGDVDPGFTAYAIALRDRARPLEAGLERRLVRNLAARLLVGLPGSDADGAGRTGTPPTEELEQLVRSGDESLLAAYEAEARGSFTVDRMRDHPSYLAGCFVAWNSFEGRSPAWDRVRVRLLDEFLRPTVRRLPDTVITEAERHLTRLGGPWAERWRGWYRPGLGRRWARRRGGADGTARTSRAWRDASPGAVEARPETEER